MLNFKNSTCGVLMALCLTSPLHAKISAKDSVEKAMIGLGKGVSNFTYDCQGNDVKASCVAKKIDYEDGIGFRNVKLDYMIDNKNLNGAISFDIQVSDPKIDKATLEFIPKRVVCSSPSNLQGKTYKGQLNCEISAPTYVLKTKGVGSMESHRFLNKDIDKVFDDLEQMLEDIDDSNMQQKLKDFKVDIREIVLDVKGIQFANKMFNVLKKDDPNFTKEQYNATVNMGVAMVPVGLANAKVSESSLEQVSKAAAALGDIALSKKQQAIITLKRKSAAMLELADLLDLIAKIDADPSVLLKYLDEYEISVVTR